MLAHREAARRKCVQPRPHAGTLRMLVMRFLCALKLRTERVSNDVLRSSRTCLGEVAPRP